VARRWVVTQLVADTNVSIKRFAAMSGRRSAGKWHHHDEFADFPAFSVVRHWAILAGIPTPEKFLAGDIQQLPGSPIEERSRFLRRQ
jgi:hypothetical protein